MALLDEVALRLPTFTEGVRLKLADGQEWEVPRPRFALFPMFDADGSVRVASKTTFGPELEYFLEGDRNEEDPLEDIGRRFKIMVKLLQANYDLKPEDLGRLLEFNMADPFLAEIWRGIGRVLIGQDPSGEEPPKLSPDGSD